MQTLSRPSCQPSPSRRPSSSPGLPSSPGSDRPSPPRARGSGRGRRPSAPPARSRTSTAPSSGRRSRARPGRRRGSRARARARPAPSPGSVIAANWRPRPPVRSQKYSRCERVSIVEPDFDEARKSVCSRSTSRSSRRIASGWVVSRTWNEPAPNVRRSTSGASDEPPMPSRTTSSNCSVAAPAKAFSSSRWSRIRETTSSQPSQRSSPESVQSDAS